MRKRNRYLTGVGVLSSSIWGLTRGRAVYRGGGGRRKLGAWVRSLAELTSADSSRIRGRGVRLLSDAEGWLRELLWRPLLVHLHGFTDCTQTHKGRKNIGKQILKSMIFHKHSDKHSSEDVLNYFYSTSMISQVFYWFLLFFYQLPPSALTLVNCKKF